MFAIVVGAMLAVVILFLAYPFWRERRTSMPMGQESFNEDSEAQEQVDLEIEKQRMLTSLSELEFERAQGKLAPTDYQRLKATDEHRLVKILDRLDLLSNPPQSALGGEGPLPTPRLELHPPRGRAMYWLSPIILGLVVWGGASGIYSYVTGTIGLEAKRVAQEQQGQSSASGGSGGQGMPNPLEMVARLEARLRENPNDLQGQIMAGRSYMALERLDDAKRAWTKVIELSRRDHEAHYNLGLILLQTKDTTDSRIFEEALAHFDTALMNVPREPVVLWYRGVALVHLKRYREADESWTSAYQNLPPGSEDAEFVKQALQNLRAGNPPLSQ
jgi:cytochrome c-type biogenesis protein CcmH